MFVDTSTMTSWEEQSIGVSNYVSEELGVKTKHFHKILLAKLLAKLNLVSKIEHKIKKNFLILVGVTIHCSAASMKQHMWKQQEKNALKCYEFNSNVH